MHDAGSGEGVGCGERPGPGVGQRRQPDAGQRRQVGNAGHGNAERRRMVAVMRQPGGQILRKPVGWYRPGDAGHANRVRHPAGNHSADAQQGHRRHHHYRRFAQVNMMGHAGRNGLAGLLRIIPLPFPATAEFAVKSQMHHPVGIESGHHDAGQQHCEYRQRDGRQAVAANAGDQPGFQQDLVLAPEAGQREYAYQAQGPDDGQPVGNGHRLAEAAHIHHIESAGGVVDAARAEEQQGLKKGVGKEVEQGGVVSPHAQGGHHIPQLAHGGVGHHPLDVVGGQAHSGGEHGRERPHQRHHGHNRLRFGEHGEKAAHQKDAGGDHRRGVDQRAHRRGAFHSVRQPGVQGELAAFAYRAGEQAQAQPQQRPAGHNAGAAGGHRQRRLPNVRDVQRVQTPHGEIVRLEKEVDDGQQKTDIPDAGDNESLLGRRGRRRAVVPETDQQVGRQAHQFPEYIHLYDVDGQHQPDHRGAEQGHIGVVAGNALIAVHIAQGIDLHHQADAGYGHQHNVG